MNAGIFGTCPVAFLGLWDTVGSVGLYNWNQSFAHTFENESVAIVRHAVSLDERRAAFRSNPWPGQSSLAMISFQWMVREADKAGLHVNDDRMQALLAQCTPKSCATMHESLKRGW
jgi:uncharacterized protein (DUF2235 family)